jgi:membrane protein YqaA with SNARE-associated domain
MFEGLVETYGVAGLFISAFISSTLAPGGSEVVLVYLISEELHAPYILVLVATVGNTLGALTTYYIGFLASSKWSPAFTRKKHFNKAHGIIQKYGSVSLLLSWLPILGDVLCLAAGWVRLNFFKSLCFITLGKFARYALISISLS